MAKSIGKIEDLTPDQANANMGTERGRAMLERSLRAYGAGRPILADDGGNVIAGNKTLEVAAEIGLGVRVVQTDGKELIVARRTDLDLDTDTAARELAYADNRVAEVDLLWDAQQVSQDVVEDGLDLSDLFTAVELDTLFCTEDEPTEAAKAEQEDDAQELATIYSYDLVFENAAQQARFHRFLVWLRNRYPEEPLLASCMTRFLADQEGSGV